jgi:hypothetical protein
MPLTAAQLNRSAGGFSVPVFSDRAWVTAVVERAWISAWISGALGRAPISNSAQASSNPTNKMTHLFMLDTFAARLRESSSFFIFFCEPALVSNLPDNRANAKYHLIAATPQRADHHTGG